jgi:hypothetical protein
MKSLVVLWLSICKLAQVLMRSYYATALLNPHCDLVCRGFEVGYVPVETLSEMSLICDLSNTHDF